MTLRTRLPRRTVVLLAIATMAVPPALAACGRDVPASLQVGTSTTAPGEREDMPSISGSTLDGATLDLTTLRGKVVVLNSWASWCDPCKKEMPDLVTLSKSVDPAKVAVVGLNVSDDPAAAKAFAGQYGVRYPSIVDAEGAQLATIPGVPPKALPSTVVIDSSGRIAARVIGAVDPTELSGIVAAVSAETPAS